MGRIVGIIAGAVVLVVVVIGGYVLSITLGLHGEHLGPGVISGPALPDEVVASRERAQKDAAHDAGVQEPQQILFGDLHVHTTFSTDAFLWALPILGGRGARPISDACDFARYCSGLDFWSINDHSEGGTPQRWQETKDAIRQCNAVANDPDNPDTASFMGFEWTQVGRSPLDHYGHKNVIFRGLEDDEISQRPIAAGGVATDVLRGSAGIIPVSVPLLDFANRQSYFDFMKFTAETREVPLCPEGVPSRDLPPDCFEVAYDPGDLVRRLDSQGMDHIVIPHGSSWGFYTPAGNTWDKQLKATMRPEAMRMIEVMSGHGNSEEYRSWRAVDLSLDEEALGDREAARLSRAALAELVTATCPGPSSDYLPSCWRAGEIIRERCLAEGTDAQVCEGRAEEARGIYARMGIAGHLAVTGETAGEWLDSGQCRDCFLPAFNHRPGSSAQYGLAITNFDDPAAPLRFRWSFIASSDTHRARPGTGYKEVDRRNNTDSAGPVSQAWMTRLRGAPEEPTARAAPLTLEQIFARPGFQLTETERQASFWMTGGLAAVHSAGRDRDSIWEAMKNGDVYGTSGPRMLLWFDMLNGVDGVVSMGAQTSSRRAPALRVRAVGSLKQKPGCPDFADQALDREYLETLCSGECYHPSDERAVVTRIEIVRIRPQTAPGEDVGGLIDDPWRVHECPGDPAGCTATFRDTEFTSAGRDTVYYARAIQEASPAINADNLRCTYDEEGNCVSVDICHGSYQTPAGDECLRPTEPRAWSSPIYVDYEG